MRTMKFLHSIALASVSVFGAVSAAATANTTAITFPTHDEFYTAPKNLSDYKNGDIIRSREVPHPLIGVGAYKAAYQLLYRTDDTSGNATSTVTTVIIPAMGGDPHSIISYQIPEDSAFIGCAPSYQIQQGEVDPGIPYLLDTNAIVNMPDYEGDTSAFGAGILAGQATLDSVRAVLQSKDITGVDSNAKVALWGYSGGSIATGWAGELQPTYAPELEIAAIAVGGFVANLTAVMLNINGGPHAGYIPTVLLGILSQYPDLKSLYSEVKPADVQKLLNPLSQCSSSNIREFKDQDIFDFFQDGEQILYKKSIQKVLAELTMGQSAIKVPMLVYEGMKDEIVPVDSVDAIVNEFCHEGTNIRYYKNPDTDHIETAVNGFLLALEFLVSALNGDNLPPSSGCTTVTTKFTVDYSALTAKNSNATIPPFPMVTGTGNAQTASAVASSTPAVTGNGTDHHRPKDVHTGGASTSTASIAALILAIVALAM